MTALLFLGISLAGGLGAACRFVLDGLIKTAVPSRLPLATMAINISGSFGLGLLVGLAVPSSWLLVAGTGFLGGYTTFSTASYETVRLMQEREWMRSLVTGFGVLVAATGAAALGLCLGS
ncbi:chromosome condensation protein CrcB [Epidermidibacterium keratini]|uniref:Fluoride-specific ion channel FluC n=1 Tax=Epidermidibacterium keratini TaxID=1891644 RepID=A0A7L4YRA9_9ACTN|nr:CrcB family protein [Epidermidibacterium keratini]QHC01686.1 chromosome condensation protein CrcB [Epidermidibacterium keratini]